MLRRTHAIFSDDSKKLLQRKFAKQYVILCLYIRWPYMYTPPVHTRKLTWSHHPWKMMVGRVLSFWDVPAFPVFFQLQLFITSFWSSAYLYQTSIWMTFIIFSANISATWNFHEYLQQSPPHFNKGHYLTKPNNSLRGHFLKIDIDFNMVWSSHSEMGGI